MAGSYVLLGVLDGLRGESVSGPAYCPVDNQIAPARLEPPGARHERTSLVQDDPNQWATHRPDLELLFRHGMALAEDRIVDLFVDAVLYAAATLDRNARTRMLDDPLAPQHDVDRRTAAACYGVAEALACAAARYRWPGGIAETSSRASGICRPDGGLDYGRARRDA